MNIEQEKVIANLLKEMEQVATKIRILINGIPPEELLGYIYGQLMMMNSNTTSPELSSDTQNKEKNEIQFLLEYVHAVLASDVAQEYVVFDERKCGELFALSRNLREKSMCFAMVSSINTQNKDFGSNTADIEFQAKSSWLMLRGNRYQVLEGEFYQYVLAPHDDVLKDIYGIGAIEIAEGFQQLANATRVGQANAIEEMMKQFQAAQDFAEKQNKPLEDAMEEWVEANAQQTKSAGLAVDDMLRGGISNVSRHTKLPSELLADLAYSRGEELDFFSEGDFSGTPYRTLPARKKPLIKLGEDYYAVDPCFIRDAGYRSLLFNLLQKKPDYKEAFKERQKVMSEAAFPEILAEQLSGAVIYQEVYYKDPKTKQWAENDTLVLIDDVLYLVEAKAGAAASIASPELDFKRHSQSIKDLIIKAYKQCERFFEYLKSADEVPLFNLINGKYEEVGKLRHSDYRVMIPIGLTVESFSPFSSFSKNLPQVKPLVGQYSFVSISIDDLFVLRRMLPTPGVFAHYMEVRQAIAGIKQGLLFDEFDHLGAYLTKNRFDQDIIDQSKDENASLVIYNGMSDVVDSAFASEQWETSSKPTQEFPEVVLKVLSALDISREPGWLSVDSLIRDFGEEARNNFAKYLTDLDKTIEQHPARYFAFGGEANPILVWMQNSKYEVEWEKVNHKASVVAISIKVENLIGVLLKVGKRGVYEAAQPLKINVPVEQTKENMLIFEDAKRMNQQIKSRADHAVKGKLEPKQKRKVGRNASCPCGSGKKYKRCHGL
ncbi:MULTISPECIES: YecA family protein [Psychrobacter]|nr:MULTISPECIES: SEC-C metal-binding domain-containing protein [Psychrobacter]MBA6245196.1 SEC-C domain-containing protein [Psychrobacter sp. Urea-trap-18]MBA6285597.1 SEC-C domain-containing protein [Psychrobacter sp. Urea-trap-16]MBA6318844.1 SEC-C domain-containing protein [Psychrobacter sp. Urea-trap-20]MBA6334015.1 SEC-C domain-containing protein [Psychrobacter sp. Urea-trap-19]OEH68827.1 MAG: preprotein translocase subunit SecA [Psychrobacter sp. B29-1]|tara:strand:+ start:469 stop:2790 length:2322 start_codon:yes stop_codon:yes gene_type:complete